MTRLSCWFVLLFLVHVGSAYGQGGSPPSVVIDGTVGSTTFVDEAMVHHLLIGASPRVYVTHRLSIGPEVVFMRGPGFDRDLLVTGNVPYDLAPVGWGPLHRVAREDRQH